ncbi:MAG: hypothetical protein AAGK97_05960, partial [Bacteroidota bacterium]
PKAELQVGSSILNPASANIYITPNLSTATNSEATLGLFSDSTSSANGFYMRYYANSHILDFISDQGSNNSMFVLDGNNNTVRTDHFIFDAHRLEVINSGNSIFIGQNAGLSDDLTFNDNVAIGYNALRDNVTGIMNVAIGYAALEKIPGGGQNVAIGRRSLTNFNAGQENVAVGEFSGGILQSGGRNIFIGKSAGRNISSGFSNTIVGYNDILPSIAPYEQNNAVKIGHNAGRLDSADNVLHIGVTESKSLIKGDFAADSLRINGRLAVSGKVKLGSDGNAPSPGELRFTGSDFQGYDGGGWKSLTVGGAGDTDWTQGTNRIFNVPDNVGVGTSNPNAKLEVLSSTENNGVDAIFKILTPDEFNFPNPPIPGYEMLFDANEIDVNGLGLGFSHMYVQSNSNGNLYLTEGGGTVYAQGTTNGPFKMLVEGNDNVVTQDADRGALAIRTANSTGIMLLDNNEIDVSDFEGQNDHLFVQSNTNGNTYLVTGGGKIGVGTTNIPADYRMALDGNLIAEEVRVQLSGDWPDYVFEEDYQLQSLAKVESYIEKQGHLPGVPSAKVVEQEGHHLGAIQRTLLEKIEELTLYTIQQQKEIETLKAQIQKIQKEQ